MITQKALEDARETRNDEVHVVRDAEATREIEKLSSTIDVSAIFQAIFPRS